MPRLLTLTLCALLLTGVAAGAAGCGEDRSNLLPGDTVAEIDANLDLVNAMYESGDCFGAIRTASQIKTQVLNLGSGVDKKLRKNLDDGVNELVVRISSGCTGKGATTTTDETTVEPDVTTTGSTGTTDTTGDSLDESTGSGKDKSKKKDTGKPTKPDTKTTAPTKPDTTTPEPPEPTTPPDTGGVGPGT